MVTEGAADVDPAVDADADDADVDADSAAATETYPDGVDTDARRLLYDLVSTPSVSGAEGDAAAVLVEFFAANGREARVDAVGNVRAPATEPDPGDDVVLTSHVDTVPGEVPVRVETVPAAEARWGGEAVTGGSVPELWGRGAVDATGSLAAMAAAAVATGAGFVGVVGEETDSRGARHLVADRPAPAAVVNGEPSGWDGLTLGYRGFLTAEYRVTTESAHSSRPEPNAIQHATDWWERVEAAVAGDDAGAVFESVTAKPVAVDGGLAADGHAVEATVDAQFRIPPTASAAELRAVVEDCTDRGTVVFEDAIPPTTASPRTDLARAFRVAVRNAGGDPSLLRKTGTADANLYDDAWDCPVVTYGPGDSALDHTPEERLPLPELDRSVAVLSSVLRRLR
ncbi:MAG: [LysW]-lysine hydrolase [Halolamina sp.]